VDPDISQQLEKRLGRLHAKLRLGIEADHEAQVLGQGITYFHIENLTSSHFGLWTCCELPDYKCAAAGTQRKLRSDGTTLNLRKFPRHLMATESFN
jgi:hypothetical protein